MNGDSPRFYENDAFSKIESWNPHHLIFAGDFNLVMDQDLDTMNYHNVNNPQARHEVIKKI